MSLTALSEMEIIKIRTAKTFRLYDLSEVVIDSQCHRRLAIQTTITIVTNLFSILFFCCRFVSNIISHPVPSFPYSDEYYKVRTSHPPVGPLGL